MRKNPTALISAGMEMLPGIKPPVAPGNGGIIGISPGIKLPVKTEPAGPIKDISIIKQPVVLQPPVQQPPPRTGGPTPVQPPVQPPKEEKKINPLFLYGGIAIALYLLFK